jgi:mono/diheme cytochrome c family protein/plastocyanin/cytochrome c551/c552
MPVPTDTLWNIKRLNIVFAVTSIILVLTMLWSVLQDYDKSWRTPQKSGETWDAALTREKLRRTLPPEEARKLAAFKELVARLDRAIQSGPPQLNFDALSNEVDQTEKLYAGKHLLSPREVQTLEGVKAALRDKRADLSKVKSYNDRLARIDSESATLTFKNNNLKSTVTVDEASLERARTEGRKEDVREIEEKLAPGREKVGKNLAQLGEWKREQAQIKGERARATKEIDAFRKLVSKLGETEELLNKKLSALQPSGFGQLSAIIRDAPLMDFMNRAQNVRQVVLPDVMSDYSFVKTESTDRCMTCHINIDKKDYTEEKILSFLEEQLAISRNVIGSRKPQEKREASLDRPNLCGMPEFWHAWASELAPEAAAKESGSINTLAGTIGTSAKVTYKGNAVTSLPAAREGDKERRRQGEGEKTAEKGSAAERDAIIGALLISWELYEKPADNKDWKLATGDVTVTISPNVDPSVLSGAREAAFTYTAAARKAAEQSGTKESQRLLRDRYRYALVAALNPLRHQLGFSGELDPSPAILAHPRLDLYADPDSKHPMDTIGCTSCHDGSGMETTFVLAAHTARKILVDSHTGEPVLDQQVINKPAEVERPDLSNMLKAVLKQDEKAQKLALTFDLAAKPEPAPKEPEEVEYIDPVSGREHRAVQQEKYWAEKYEKESGTTFEAVREMWDFPMRPPEYLQANCARCHSNIHDIKDEAPVLYEGRAMFAKLGCVNCHQMDSIPTEEATRKVGPDLRHVNEKLSTAFIESWIWAPKAFRPSTQMPHFFMLENSSSPEELRRTQQEVRAITTYLLDTATPTPSSPILSDPKNKMPAIPDEDKMEDAVARGRKIFLGDTESSSNTVEEAGIGCIACHTNLNEVGLKWISLDLVNSPEFIEELRRKNQGKTPSKSDLTKAARAKYDAMSYNERQLYALEHFTDSLGAFGPSVYPDGAPKPVFQHHGPELSGIGTKLLAGGRKREEAIGWLYGWVMDPRHYSEQTVMPRLRLSPDDAMDLACYLLQQTRKAKEKKDTWKAQEIAADKAKVDELVAMFLYSQFDEPTARKMAVDNEHVTKLARTALKNPTNTAKEVDDRLSKMSLADKQLDFLGSKLITHYGCMNCHTINGMENAATPCANLSDWGQKREDKLDFAYLAEHKVKDELPPTTTFPLVNGLSVEAVTQIIPHINAKDWAEPISGEVRVAWPELPHSRTSWLEHKLKNTRIYDRGRNLLEPEREYEADHKTPKLQEIDGEKVPVLKSHGKPYEKLRMPTFYLKDEQVHAIVTFVISNRDKLVTQKLLDKTNTEDAVRIAKGRQVVEKYNCVGCHRTEFNQPAIQQYFQKGTGYWDNTEIPLKAPPSLHGEGSRVQQQWLFNFLKHVEQAGTGPQGKIRPQPYIHMPSFPLTDDETTIIAAYFGASTIKEGKELAKKVEPLIKETIKSMGTDSEAPSAQAQLDAEQVWPEDDWWKEPKWSALAQEIKDWGIANGSVRPQDFSAGTDEKSLNQAYMTALYDARFISSAWDTRYPFVDVAQPTPSDERFKKGELFFHYLNCQQCHIVGRETDQLTPAEKAKGLVVNAAPKGPNLRLAAGRLQRHWVHHWVQQTDVIQPGSAMPAIFFAGRAVPAQLPKGTSDVVFSLPGLPHLTTTPDNAELIKQVQYNFGQTVEEQKALLLDFVFSAGPRGYTSFDPATTAATTQPATAPAATPPATAAPIVPLEPTPKVFKPLPIPGFTVPLPPKAAPATQPSNPAAPEAPAHQFVQTGPSITGTISFDGTPPPRKTFDVGTVPACAQQHPGGKITDDSLLVSPSGAIKDVIVYVKNAPSGAPVPPPATLDQKGCMYSPHVLAVMRGQQVMISNSDTFDHNVHALPVENSQFNVPEGGNTKPGIPKAFNKPEPAFTVKCDIHPWMNARIMVLPHPFFAQTDANGKYTINNLPPGKYTVSVWSEKCASPADQTIEVKPGGPSELNLKLKLASGE